MRLTLAPLLMFSLGMGCDFFVGTNEPWPLDAGEALNVIEGGAVDTNPVGEACPTTNLGHTASSGTKRFRIANLKFVGYRPKAGEVDTTSGSTGPVSLCDYYNPTGKNGNLTVIHMSAASRWCGPCSHETSDISGYDYQSNVRTGAGIAADTAALGVVFVQALIDGTNPGTGATLGDLQVWTNSHQSNFAELLDPGPVALRDFSDGSTLPWNADIDARSMEILQVGVGGAADLEGEVKTWVAWTASHTAMP